MRAMSTDPLTFAVLRSRAGADAPLARLCERLGRMLDRPVEGVRASSYDELVELVARGHAQIAWMSPFLAALAEDRCPLRPLLVASRGGRAEYRAVLFAHTRSPMRNIDDLRGATVAWVDRSSGSGYLVPRLTIAAAGHDLRRLFAEELFVGSHDEVVRAVCERRAAVGATFADTGALAPFGARGPLRALLFSEPIPNDLIMAHGLLPLADAMGFAAALHAVAAADGEERTVLSEVFAADAFEFTDGTHLGRIRTQVRLARRLGLLLQM